MSKCILCLKEASFTQLISADERINDSTTLAEAIRENIECSFLILKDNESHQLACQSCFTCFKSFYSLLAQIRNNYREIKDEETEAFPINFCEITEPQSPLSDPESIKFDPNINLRLCKVEIERFDEESFKERHGSLQHGSDLSDFEWELDESTRKEWEDVKSGRRRVQLPKEDESNSSNGGFESSTGDGRQSGSKSQSYIRYIRQCDLTPEILASKQQFVTIDGVEYKVPKRPLKAWKEQNKKLKAPNPNKRPHRSHDQEGEEKIRNFVEVKCHVCEEQFDAFWRVRKHVKRFHPDQTAYLTCCNRKFTRRYALLDHIEWHDRSKVHSCELCGKEYKTRKILEQHINVVHLKIAQNSSSEFMCTHCGKIFKTSSAMRTHQKAAHIEGNGRTFECFICHRESFKNEFTLQRHMKYLHDPDSPKYKTTICHICSAMLKVVSMKHHMQAKHSNDIKVKVKCEICDHWIVKTSIKQHMEKHKNNTGAECDVCGKFFKSKLSVYKHKTVVHSTNYKFQCTYCDKKFHREVKMKEHIAVRHTRDFPFKCRVDGCGREFRAEANWKIHEKKTHPVEYEKYFKPHYLRSPTHQASTDIPDEFPQIL